MRVSLSQIAQKAGVSTAAVSKALRDLNDISPSTKRRVKKIAHNLGYRANLAARALATRRTMTIGTIVTFPHIPTVIERLRGIQAAASKTGYAVFNTFHDNSPVSEAEQLKLIADRVDGIIFTPSKNSPELLDCLQQINIPVVCMSEPLPGATTDFVGIDDTLGGRMAAEHLVNTGHKRIAYFGDSPQTPSDKAILNGMCQVLAGNSLHMDDAHVTWGNAERTITMENVRKLLSSGLPPDAIFAFSDLTALWALKTIQDAGLVVPRDIALVGFDDIELAQMATVPLTSISQPNYEIGRHAAHLLLERLTDKQGADSIPPRRVIFPAKLAIRASTQANAKPD